MPARAPVRYTLQTFTFTHGTLTASIRTVLIDGNPWFVAADTCRALECYVTAGNVNTTMAVAKLNDHEKTSNRIEGIGKGRPVILISESGLYKLVMRSDKPQARAFQDWVCGVVLPAIRKDGMYVMGEEKIAEGKMTMTKNTHATAPAIVTRIFEYAAFQFREDGWLNATKAAKAFGKHLHNFWKHSDTAPYMEELALSIGAMDKSDLVQTRCGNGSLPSVGTWLHPRLSVFFARWLDPKFAVFCDTVIYDLIGEKAELVITKPAESAVMTLPTDYLSALEALVVAERERVRLAADYCIAY